MRLNASQIVKPVILPVPEEVRQWHPRERVKFLSKHARGALALSAGKSGIVLGELTKDAEGAPLPSNGYYWSLTHKTSYVAAVVSTRPVGIDLEAIKSVHAGMYGRVAGEVEWGLAPEDCNREEIFFCFWTAKEAVMKAAGTGIKDLSRIKIHQVLEDESLVLAFEQKKWTVQQYFFEGHIAAIAANGCKVEWAVVSEK